MADRYSVQARLGRETHERLTAYLRRITAAAKAAPSKYRPQLSKGLVSLSDAIDELLYQLDCETQRKGSYGRQKSQGSKSRKKREQPDTLALDRWHDDGGRAAG